jgi:hypothetical protein
LAPCLSTFSILKSLSLFDARQQTNKLQQQWRRVRALFRRRPQPPGRRCQWQR